MSTIGALILAVIVVVAMTLPIQGALSFVPSAMDATNTGGPILFSLILGCTFGYQAYAASYVGLRVFKKASAQVFFVIALLLMLSGQVMNSMRIWTEDGGNWITILVGVMGAIATFIGLGLGVSAAREDIGRAAA